MATSRTFGRFALRMDIRAKQVETGAARLVREAAIATLQAVTVATPVDTGRARSNWIVSIGEPSVRTRKAFSPGKNLGSGEGANLRAVLEEGNAKIAQRKTGKALYITNNLPYIARLNNGSSAQAPKMFVEQAIKIGTRKLRTGQTRILGK